MNYNLAFKHVEKIAKKSANIRPVLTGIHHKEDKITATDGHRLLRAKIDKMTFETHIVPTKKGVDPGGSEYPKVDNLIANVDDMYIKVVIDQSKINVIKHLLKTSKTLKFDFGVFKISNGIIKLEVDASRNNDLYDTLKDTELSLNLGKIETQDEDKVYTLNIDYLIDLFDFLHDTKEDTLLGLKESVTTPIQFTTDDYDYIVVPIRRQ